jgi:hypothetical protein
VNLAQALLRAWRSRGKPPPRKPTAFITGDAAGSVFENVETDADVFIEGDRENSVFRNVVHRTRRQG